MNNKKGFTLIEVIGVITVLAIILIVSVPALTKTLKRNEQQKYNDYIDNLSIAAENYVVGRLKEGYSFDEVTYVSLGNLVDAGYVKELVTNPNNEKILSRDTRIKISKEADGTFKYDIQEYYTDYSDYHIADLILQYDSVEYNEDKLLKDLVNNNDLNVTDIFEWTEQGLKFITADHYINIPFNENISMSFSFKMPNSNEDSFYTLFDYYSIWHGIEFSEEEDELYILGEELEEGYKYNENNSIKFEKDKNYTMTFVRNNGKTNYYINNVKLYEANNNNIDSNFEGFGILNENITVNNVLLYNEPLTDEQVGQIHELNIERFGE